jgi:hypothetical protein
VTLIELLEHEAEWTDDDTDIYVAQPWQCGSKAILVSPAPATTEPIEQHGQRYAYFLETFIAREFMHGYAASAEGADASAEKRCERLIRYAIDDA